MKSRGFIFSVFSGISAVNILLSVSKFVFFKKILDIFFLNIKIQANKMLEILKWLDVYSKKGKNRPRLYANQNQS